MGGTPTTRCLATEGTSATVLPRNSELTFYRIAYVRFLLAAARSMSENLKLIAEDLLDRFKLKLMTRPNC